MIRNPNTPRPTLDEEAVWTHLRAAANTRTKLAVWTALGDVPVLLAELDRLRTLLSDTRTEFANLLAAARATLAAHHDAEPDPLYYLRDEVAAQQPPPRDETGRR